MTYDWNEITSQEKKELSKLKPILISGSREMSPKRIQQLAQLSKQKSVLWGVLKDEYISGLEGCPQFRTLTTSSLGGGLRRGIAGDITILEYYQRDWKYVLKELEFSLVILVNGSWHKMIHTLPEYWEIVNKKTPYKLVSPFVNEKEAKDYVQKISHDLEAIVQYDNQKIYTDEELLNLANTSAKRSFDWVYQTGAVLAKNGRVLGVTHNKILPYETYSAHFGSVREKNFAPLGDLNYYDTLHAEIDLLIQALNKKLDITDSTLYINLLPCPNCAKAIAQSKIKEVVYQLDHSDGYAVKLLESVGKKVRRLVI